jgi:hypothetical protein
VVRRIEKILRGDLDAVTEMEVGVLAEQPASKGEPDEHHPDDPDRGRYRDTRRTPRVERGRVSRSGGRERVNASNPRVASTSRVTRHGAIRSPTHDRRVSLACRDPAESSPCRYLSSHLRKKFSVQVSRT